MSGAVKKTLSKRSLEGFLRTGYLIHDVSRLRRALYDQRSRHLGITRSQWWVLFNLSRGDGRPLNQNELAQMLEMGSASMGELLQRLEKGDFIKRQAVPGDRRSKHVVIAERGLEVLEHMRLVARANNEAIMAGISMDEQKLLNELLSKMKNNLLAQVALGPGNPEDATVRAEVGSEEGDGAELLAAAGPRLRPKMRRAVRIRPGIAASALVETSGP